MEYYLVSPLRVVHRRDSALTYHGPKGLSKGQVIAVSVGSKSVPAVVLQTTPKPSFETKSIEQVVEGVILPPQLLTLHEWLSTYYASHPVAVWQTMLPRGILKNRRKTLQAASKHRRERTHILLNKEQSAVYEQILKRPAQTTLLHGITGSGKTAVYIELAKQALSEGHSVVVLVPEIALTSQLVSDFTSHIDDVMVTHSTMTEAQRHLVWLEALRSETPRVVVGPRSALFTPLRNIGLIVIDESHEPSYKQESTPRYSAQRAASILAKEHGARLVLGSATPSVTDYFLASKQPGAIVQLITLARKDAVTPTVSVVDMTKKQNFNQSRFLSNELLAQMKGTLDSSHQALLFHNRRGSAPITLCENCGWSAACPRCFVPLTLHADRFELRCHICNHRERVPTHCPDCNGAHIIHKGIGTKRIAEEVAKLFPNARIARFDGDNTAGETVDSSYQALYDGDIDIIIGTQVVAKGLDLPKLRFVGVVQADSGLALPDYQSSERVFQLLTQVSGRVGRNEHASHVVLQSYQPEHPAVKFGTHQDYAGFYDYALSERKRANFPPYTHLLKLTCAYKTEAASVRASRALAQTLRKQLSPSATLLGPAPAFYERARDSYRWQIIVKSPRRGELAELIQHIPPTHWQYELDPISLL